MLCCCSCTMIRGISSKKFGCLLWLWVFFMKEALQVKFLYWGWGWFLLKGGDSYKVLKSQFGFMCKSSWIYSELLRCFPFSSSHLLAFRLHFMFDRYKSISQVNILKPFHKHTAWQKPITKCYSCDWKRSTYG